jgi:uncharacterized membrane protein
MSETGEEHKPEAPSAPRRAGLMARLRLYFLTGLVIAAPLVLTLSITWWIIQWIDNLVLPFVPPPYRPESYSLWLPGFGVVVALAFITILGLVTRNYLGGRMVALGESLLGRMPVVRSLYRGLKQIFETVVSTRAKAFQTVGLIEYPRKGIWAIVFLAGDAKGELEHRLNETVAVFLPTTPNPTSGFLLYVKRSEIQVLDMSLEEAAKLVISGGLVTPEFKGAKRLGKVEKLNPPSAA